MLRLGAFLLALAVTPAFASTWNVDSVHSNIGFTVRHLVTKVSGSFNTFEGTLQFDDKNPIQVRSMSLFEPKVSSQQISNVMNIYVRQISSILKIPNGCF